MEEPDETASYGPHSIQVLTSVEAIRKRPGMYIGDVYDGSGLEHMLWEVLGNSVDEHVQGHCHDIRVELTDGWVEVEDDGRGIPVDELGRSKRSALEHVLTTLHASGSFGEPRAHVHLTPSLTGVGLVAVNALSVEFVAEVKRDGRRWRIECSRGEVVRPLEDVGPARDTGTLIRFRPDPDIFTSLALDERRIRERLVELVCLSGTLRFRFEGEPLHEPDGIRGWTRRVADARGPSLFVTGTHEGAIVEVAAAWGQHDDTWQRSYVSYARTRDGGTHVRGFWSGLREALGATTGDVSDQTLVRRLLRGAAIVVHVGLYEPRFGAPTKDRLVSPEATAAVRHVVSRALSEDPALLEQVRRRVFAD